MTDREKLFDLLYDCLSIEGCGASKVEKQVDYLLENNVIVPPCRVGKTVYVLTSDSPTGIEESRVKRMQIVNLQDGMTIRAEVPCVYDDWGKCMRHLYSGDFGETVFLTKEEAEKALAERSKQG